MAEQSAEERLREAFGAPLPDGEGRRVVFWHDVDGAFSDDFDRLAEDGLGAERPVAFARADNGSLFELKRDILRVRADSDFLVYTRRPRDFSEGGLEGNWLADIELVSEHFQADKASMLLGELNAGASAHDAVARHERFFRAADRRAAYLKRVPETSTPADVATGIASAVLKAPTARTEDIVRSLLCALHGEGPDAVLERFEKLDALDTVAAILAKRLGYAGDPASEELLSEHLLMSAASCTLPEDLMRGYEGHVSKPHARSCLNIVRDWLNDTAGREGLYEIARAVERNLNVPEKLAGADALALADTDVFPCVNEIILEGVMSSMADGADRASEAMRLRQLRKDRKWYKRVEDYFDLMAAAAESEGFYRSHPQGFHAAKPADAWKAYTEDWCSMDADYRAFCVAMGACRLNVEDVPDSLRDAADRLAERVENVYANWFLPKVNDCWVRCCERDWEERGRAGGIDAQRDFFQEYPARDRREYKRTLVVVADGMRYEVGREVALRLERETKGTVRLSAMQSAFPSVTEFGMAELLPNAEVSYSWDDGKVLVDGMPTDSTPARQAVLQKTVAGTRAVLAGSLESGNRKARKELVGDAPLVYVYQDKIDSTGEKPKLEHDVPRACADTVDEVVALCKIAVNDLKINRVIVTADHGFIYTSGPLREQDKVSKADVGSGDVQLHRRHILSRENIDSLLFVKMNMGDVHGGEYYGLGLRECIRMKSASGNKNYAHGGVSLQEMCVPVIELRNRNIKSKERVEQEKARMRLVSTKRSITSSMFHVDLFQTESVSGKVLPAEYELCLVDGSGNPVTDMQKAHADMTTEDERARVSRPMFTLREGISYPPGERYYLVCRDKETGEISWKEEFTIDMAFAPTVDFGF
ncbi:MAG: BREX-1 system phosphatase PglZ type A [Coriobacteriaceae bacterium]|nr:BREX-1 system phosphatase PglZ type A [Coriobacteriaceae bacterium]